MEEHDKLFARLTLILTKLDNGERLTQSELASEFGVSLRTIQRDINRLNYFPIEKSNDGTYKFSDGFSLKRTSFGETEMLTMYLSLSMIDDISPSVSKSVHTLMSKLLLPNFTTPYLIKQDPFESIDMDSRLMNNLEEAINNKRVSTIRIKNIDYQIEPYKIVSFDEIWYLFAKDISSQKIKTFFISEIDSLNVTQNKYILNQPIDSVLENVHTAWFEDGVQFDVQIKVKEPISHYFRCKKHLVSQSIVKENKDGSLIVNFSVSSDEEVDNLIKAWLPHIEVVSPERLRTKILDELECYVQSVKHGALCQEI